MDRTESNDSSIKLTIKQHYRPRLEFSLSSTSGLHEVQRMYVEVLKIYPCAPGPVMIEALFFSTRYHIALLSTIRKYPLLPPTADPSATWVLKDKDIDLFGIDFTWPSMTAVDIVIKARVHDHLGNTDLTISSPVIRLQRNGEYVPGESKWASTLWEKGLLGTDRARSSFTPPDSTLPFSDYLYKLMSIDGFLESGEVARAVKLNRDVSREIAALKESADSPFLKDLDKIQRMLRTHVSRSAERTTILFLAAEPSGLSQLRLGEELREIQEKLQLASLRDGFNLQQRMSVRPMDISQALLDTEPAIVHFSGHGDSRGRLYFENPVGEVLPIPVDVLALLFEQFKDQVKCVILNACYSDQQAEAISRHINYVIGMNQAIGDRAAIAFSIGFYQALGAGRTIRQAYNLGCVQISLQGVASNLIPILHSKPTSSKVGMDFPFVIPDEPDELI